MKSEIRLLYIAMMKKKNTTSEDNWFVFLIFWFALKHTNSIYVEYKLNTKTL